jgi:hypothetical protein
VGAVRVGSVIVPAFSLAQTRTQAPTEGHASYRDRRRRGRKGERSASTDPVADRVQLPEIPDAVRNATARHRRHAAIGPIPTLRGTTSSPLRSSAVDDLEFHIDHAALRGITSVQPTADAIATRYPVRLWCRARARPFDPRL